MCVCPERLTSCTPLSPMCPLEQGLRRPVGPVRGTLGVRILIVLSEGIPSVRICGGHEGIFRCPCPDKSHYSDLSDCPLTDNRQIVCRSIFYWWTLLQALTDPANRHYLPAYVFPLTFQLTLIGMMRIDTDCHLYYGYYVITTKGLIYP